MDARIPGQANPAVSLHRKIVTRQTTNALGNFAATLIADGILYDNSSATSPLWFSNTLGYDGTAVATLNQVAINNAYNIPVGVIKAYRVVSASILVRSLSSNLNRTGDIHISFVNGIFTRRGGKHVDAVARAVLSEFCDGPGKKLDLKPAQLKDALTFFVNATIVNPAFDSQTKETLTTPVAKFGSTFKISSAFVARLAKEGGLLDEAQAVLDARLSREAKKSDGRKSASVRGIVKLEDALWAGTAKSTECTLILTEGDSAASMAIAGLKVVGRERYGVFPLRGKILNVRDASIQEKTDNKEITAIKLS